MRAVRIVAPSQPLAMVELPDLPPAPGEVTIEVRACGICHSDAHYRGGFGNIALPRTPGHEIAGIVREVGDGVTRIAVGDCVAVHYLRSCGACRACRESGEQFCQRGEMIGKQCDGGYADFVTVPETNAIAVPPSVPLELAAVMMCSTATAYHALHVGRLREGERVAILGFGGLGVSALELARALGARSVAVVDVVPEKLALAEARGATTEVENIDLAIDFTGRPDVMTAALRALAPGGRLVVVALSEAPLTVNPYRDLLAKERSIIGCSDHTRGELVELLDLAATGRLELRHVISARVPFDAAAINAVLDGLEQGTGALRSVIVR
ncbi:MAG TPA: alcohol dehydrogenase catalytic domain-containing protein [Thermoanaerobaculia bacterium]|nr:alcohol dehydrogenase catalytic domain-containing protein [Thermoanaerobaculia bacterium]